jgi:signal transduction histidine kinase
VRTVYAQSLPVLLANVANAAIVTIVFWPSPLRVLLVIWASAIVGLALARGGLELAFRRRSRADEETPLWGRLFVLGSWAAGTLWGGAALFLFGEGVPLADLVLPFAVGGMVAGAAGTIACYMPAFLGFSIPALGLLGIAIAFEQQRAGVAMGLMQCVFVLGITRVAWANNQTIARAFRLRFHNEELLVSLSKAQESLEQANRTLEDRVAERGRAMERQGEALRQAQRLESLGLLAGGVAHDFNNLLTVVMGNVELLLGTMRATPEENRQLAEVRAAAARAAGLVKQLLAFSRRQVMEPRTVDLVAILFEMRPLLARLVGDGVALDLALPGGPLFVKADPLQLEQVIMNLTTNARDAMPKGGTLVVRLDTSARLPESVPPSPREGLWARLSVRDTGTGMDGETARRVFDPFFTTKEVGRGTGLGLATVFGIVDQSGGRVLVESQPGRGSVFTVYLPSVSLLPATTTMPAIDGAGRAS